MTKLCNGKTACLKKFVFEVFSLEFSEDPDYKKLEKLLTEAFQIKVSEDMDEAPKPETLKEKFAKLFK